MTESAAIAAGAATPRRPGMNLFERYLTLWVAFCIVAGIALGQALPGAFRAIGARRSRRSTFPSPC